MSLFVALKTVDNNKNKKPVKFLGDMLIFVILFRLMYLPQITTLRVQFLHEGIQK